MPEASFGWTAAKWAWENRGEILTTLKKVRDWFRSDPGRGILIIGPGGVGKSTLARLLSGEFDWLLDEPSRYDESFRVEESSLRDDPKTRIVVPPGQVSRREVTWPDVERNLTAGQYRGVVLVSANGFHSLSGLSYRAHRLYDGSKERFLAAYLQSCRAEEVAVLARVAASARTASGKMWILSVVTKEDLWWVERQQAADRYSAGEYAAAIDVLTAAKGPKEFRHELVTASLVISSFVSGEAELLAKNVAGYDHRQQVGSVRRLFEVVNALQKWETS